MYPQYWRRYRRHNRNPVKHTDIYMAGSRWLYSPLKCCVTRLTDAQGLTHPYSVGYLVKYPLFAQILALCRARKSTNPTIHTSSAEYKLDVCMVGIVESFARHGANIWAKSLIVSNKNFYKQRAPMQWNGSFSAIWIPSSFIDWSDTQEPSMLFNST
jgi:hypothetical protein